MKLSQLFGTTLRETPSEAELPSHRLLLRAAMMRPMGSGIFALLPLGWRVFQKVQAIIRQEMDAIGGQEALMPVVNPADLWRATGRYDSVGPELLRFQDRAGRDMVLAMTHEEALTHLVKTEVRSYRQLPALVYHFQTKFRDEPRPRGGMVRVREFVMKDSYSLDADAEGLERQYEAHYRAYQNIFRRCGVEVIAVEAHTGMMGGSVSHEFMAESPYGEDTLFLCDSCGYAANAEVAAFAVPPLPAEEPLPVEEVATPDCKTIQAVADFLGVPTSKTMKAVFYTAGERLIFAVIRGDLEVNEAKLCAALGVSEIAPADEEALSRAGIAAGYASPIGVRGAVVVADPSIASGANFVAGANKPGYHLRNVNFPRDFAADILTDIAAACGGAPCSRCGGPLRAVRAIEVGHLFKLGTRYSTAVGATFRDADGEEHPVVMGSYGIGLGRLLAVIVEQHHDDRGIVWPPSVAPYDVHLVGLNLDDETVQNAAEETYRALTDAGLAVLYDDRRESPGVKFSDADLIGVPVRLTVSQRALAQGGVEVKRRTEPKAAVVPRGELLARLLDTYLAVPGGERDEIS